MGRAGPRDSGLPVIVIPSHHSCRPQAVDLGAADHGGEYFVVVLAKQRAALANPPGGSGQLGHHAGLAHRLAGQGSATSMIMSRAA